MRGVLFNDHHTADDWGLILNAKSINPPDPKYVKIAVDGRDGDLNLSRALTGDIKFNNREATFAFIATEGTQAEREELLSEITNLLHGQELQIIEPDDLDHYLVGECSVQNVFNDRAYASFTVVADCEPYRYSIEEVNRLISLSSTETVVNLTNIGRKVLTPTLIVSGSVNIKFGTTSTTLSSGTYVLTALKLSNGSTPITVSGSGTLTITYREAVL